MPAIEMVHQVYQTTGLDDENVGARLHYDATKQSPADTPAAGGRVARTPDRIPMIQLSPNATHISSKAGPTNLAVKARVPEVFREAFPAYNLGGSTTHRGNHPAAPSPWHLGSGSGSMTARGETPSLSIPMAQPSLSYEIINIHEILKSVLSAHAFSDPLVHKTLIYATSKIWQCKQLVDHCMMSSGEIRNMQQLMQGMDHPPLMLCQELSLAEIWLLSHTQEYQMFPCQQKQLH